MPPDVEKDGSVETSRTAYVVCEQALCGAESVVDAVSWGWAKIGGEGGSSWGILERGGLHG